MISAGAAGRLVAPAVGVTGTRRSVGMPGEARRRTARTLDLRYNSAFRMITGRRYVVSGRVQGVGFRFYARDAAAREGINGWVRNLPDGSVEIEAHGDYEALIRFERAIRRGPAGARVEDVLVDPAPPSERHHGFRIEP
jgi:acylphosphatase